MKRLVYAVFLLLMIVSAAIAACGKTGQKPEDSDESSQEIQQNGENGTQGGASAGKADTDEKEEDTLKREFDFETKTVMLNSGYEMPIHGIGTYSLQDETCVNAVSEALQRGVRLIDTAYMYHKE